ncbi:hypothetical protein [Paraglaciecola sp. 20A4]|uniref:hypothetical protein n=1 Tax=Paraglaciecola sp. 20A4 TaxID=2687288 RepID=UPI00140E1DCF|nr:hypothetical protein [Paraglaciecola sp. 20A4]
MKMFIHLHRPVLVSIFLLLISAPAKALSFTGMRSMLKANQVSLLTLLPTLR